jgi:hypothetical protein
LQTQLNLISFFFSQEKKLKTETPANDDAGAVSKTETPANDDAGTVLNTEMTKNN